ncbi:MAG: GMC family oxidoreductase [Pseudobacteriovorax sp.]|nr:GMC family oxidoreductase [Pseudobacteriovorax sp.]
MKRDLNRRRLIKGGLSAWLGGFALSSKAEGQPQNQRLFPRPIKDPRRGRLKLSNEAYDAVIVGSGFGGAVTAARLSKTFGSGVMIVERGKRYPKGSFARDGDDFLDSFWRQEDEKVPRPLPFMGNRNGVFDLRSYKGMDTMVAAGYGGGSLIYSAAIVKPEDPIYDQQWPESIKRPQMEYYFDVFREVMGSRQIPTEGSGREIIRQERYRNAAAANDGEFRTTEVAINFGAGDQPDPMGQESINRYGVPQESCRYCSECFVGCNYQAKNSLDLNYLHVAETKYNATVKTETQVDLIVPLDAAGKENPKATGEFGYHVYLKNLNTKQDEYLVVKAQRVILSAGTYGSTEILLRNRDWFKTLPSVSRKLGQGYSGNGDFMNFAFDTEKDDGSHFAPTVTLGVSHSKGQKDQSFVMEDFSYPSLSKILEWIAVAFEPKNPLTKWILMPSYRRILAGIRRLQSDSSPLTIMLSVGLDKSDGQMSLDRSGNLSLRWISANSKKLYDYMIRVATSYRNFWGAKGGTPFPTYLIGRNFTVHPLGGCSLGNHPDEAVTNADRDALGQVFAYQNLYVADGSLLPSALGANPALMIGALAEMVAEGITGEKPTADL